jgi:hypothetical protein
VSLDTDDVDYFPRAKRHAEKQEAGEYTYQENLRKFRESGLDFTLIDNDRIALVKAFKPGAARIEFSLRKSRWWIRGSKRSQHGTFEQFAAWYQTEFGGAA